MPTFERLDYGSPDGSQWGGTSSDKLAHYGSTPTTCIAIGPNVSSATHASTVCSTLVQAFKTIGLFQT